MAINISSSEHLGHNSNTGNITTGAMRGGDIGLSASSSFNAANLKSGQTLSGEVVAVDGNNVTLKLSNGQMLDARLDGNSNIMLGKLLSFEVKTSADSNTISLRPLYSNLSNNSAISVALKSAGLALTENNILMTKSMMEEGMSINRDALSDMARTVNSNPGANPASIVQMTKLGLAINELNITEFENYKNFEHQIIDDVNDLARGITDFITGDSLALADGNSVSVAKELMGLIDTALIDDSVLAKVENPDIDNPETENDIVNEVKNGDMTAPESTDSGENILENENTAINDNASKPFNVASRLFSALSDVIKNNLSDNPKGVENAVSNQDEILLGNQLKNLAEKLSVNNELTEYKQSDAIELIKMALKDNGITEGKDTELLDKLSQVLNNSVIKQTITDAIKSQLTLSPEKVGKDGEVEALYNRISKMSQKILDIASSSPVDMQSVSNNAQSLQNNISFMNQINQFVNYVQLPLKMYQENAHGELYVYSNKKNLQNGDGNLTALLHLDMEHLGPMDVYVSMKNFTNVTTNFKLANDELIDFILENIHMLDERLTQKGYNVSFNISSTDTLIGSGASITDEFLKDNPEMSPRNISTMQFDVRA